MDGRRETKFREALALYGRDWKKCAAHVGTRDHRAFTSHAQKYFIRLCLQGKPLPRKVAESGGGTPSPEAPRPQLRRGEAVRLQARHPPPRARRARDGRRPRRSTSNPESLVDREVCATPVEDDPKTRRGTVASFERRRRRFESRTKTAARRRSTRRPFVVFWCRFESRRSVGCSPPRRPRRFAGSRIRGARRGGGEEAKAAAARPGGRARTERDRTAREGGGEGGGEGGEGADARVGITREASSEPTEYARNRPKRERGSVVVGIPRRRRRNPRAPSHAILRARFAGRRRRAAVQTGGEPRRRCW